MTKLNKPQRKTIGKYKQRCLLSQFLILILGTMWMVMTNVSAVFNFFKHGCNVIQLLYEKKMGNYY